MRGLCEVATPEREAAREEKALATTQDELERRLRRARRGDAPLDGSGMTHARFALRVELDASRRQMWENARAKLRAQFGDDHELRAADIPHEMRRLVLARDAEGRVPMRKAVDRGPTTPDNLDTLRAR